MSIPKERCSESCGAYPTGGSGSILGGSVQGNKTVRHPHQLPKGIQMSRWINVRGLRFSAILS